MANASSNAKGTTIMPRYIHVLYPSASLGSMKRWKRIHKQTPNPNASLIRSPGVSYTDQILSFWGLLTRTVTAKRTPMNIA